MSYSVKLEKLAKEKQQSREIVNEILSFGVTEQQKLDIVFNIAISLENNAAMKEITLLLKKYRETINNEADSGNNIKDKPKIILE